MAVRISRSERRSSASFVRWLVTRASGITAEAMIIRIVDTISSSMNVKPSFAETMEGKPVERSRRSPTVALAKVGIIYLTVTDAGVNCSDIAAPSGVLATPLI